MMSGQLESFTIFVGNTYEPQVTDPTLRTPSQHKTVRDIVQSDEFDFACGNPFEDKHHELDGYTGYFVFLWYDINGSLHSDSIEGNGTISRSITSSSTQPLNFERERDCGS